MEAGGEGEPDVLEQFFFPSLKVIGKSIQSVRLVVKRTQDKGTEFYESKS